MRTIEEFKEIDRLATAEANRRGGRIQHDAGFSAYISGAIAYVVLVAFATVADAPEGTGTTIALIAFSGLVAGGTFLAVRSQQKSWFERYQRAFDKIEAERLR